MSSFFLDPNARVAVESDDGRNIVYVRAKMDLATQAKVQDELLRVQINVATFDEEKGEKTMEAMFAVKAQQLALLKHNILDWDGPGFRDEKGNEIPATPRNVGRLDPDLPLIEKVLDRINELNKAATDLTPDAEGNDGDPKGRAISRPSESVGISD